MSPCCFYGFVSKPRFSTLLKYDVKVLSCSIIHTLFFWKPPTRISLEVERSTSSGWEMFTAPKFFAACADKRKNPLQTRVEKSLWEMLDVCCCVARGSGKSALFFAKQRWLCGGDRNEKLLQPLIMEPSSQCASAEKRPRRCFVLLTKLQLASTSCESHRCLAPPDVPRGARIRRWSSAALCRRWRAR